MEYRFLHDADKQIQATKQQIIWAKDKHERNRDFRATTKVVKCVGKKTDRHNTLCAFPGCHSNCHESCHLPKNVDQEKERFLCCRAFKEHGKSALHECRKCGHDYKYHYHNEIKWVMEEKEEPIIDNGKQQAYNEAKTHQERCEILLAALEKRQKTHSEKKEALTKQLLLHIEGFQQLASSRSFLKLVQSQMDVIMHHIEAMEGDASSASARMSLKQTKEQLEEKVL